MLTPSRIQAVVAMNDSDPYYRRIISSIKHAAETTVATPFRLKSASQWVTNTRIQVGAVAGTFLLEKAPSTRRGLSIPFSHLQIYLTGIPPTS